MNIDAPCKYLDWDSKFFGFRIARCTATQLNDDVVFKVIRWCDANEIDCLYFLSDAALKTTLRLAESNSFQFVDIRVTLEKQIQTFKMSHNDRFKGHIRPSVPTDVPILREIAARSHNDSRFYNDSRFPAQKCDMLYATWIEKSCNGYANVVLVADDGSQPSGYISCNLLNSQHGAIGLFGVAAESRAKGVGSALVNSALSWFSTSGVTKVSVVTQGRNNVAQRLYQKYGFLTSSVQFWYHVWFPKSRVEKE